MVVYLPVVAGGQLGGIGKVDAAEPAEAAKVQVEDHVGQHAGLELDETAITRRMGKIGPQVPLFHFLLVVVLKTFVAAVVVQYFYAHHLGHPQLRDMDRSGAGATDQVFGQLFVKGLGKVIHFAKKFYNFILINNHGMG